MSCHVNVRFHNLQNICFDQTTFNTSNVEKMYYFNFILINKSLLREKYSQLPQQTSCMTSLLTAAYLPDLAGVQDSYDPLLSEKKSKTELGF